jgi:hypothetical protein
MHFEDTQFGQSVFLIVGLLAGIVVGYRLRSALWLVPMGVTPWLGFAAVQSFC